MDVNVVEPLQKFAKDSMMLLRRCTKPDRKGPSFPASQNAFGIGPDHPRFASDHTRFAEFQKVAVATSIGFGVMGFIGFFVKLIHIPINQIIVGAGGL